MLCLVCVLNVCLSVCLVCVFPCVYWLRECYECMSVWSVYFMCVLTSRMLRMYVCLCVSCVYWLRECYTYMFHVCIDFANATNVCLFGLCISCVYWLRECYECYECMFVCVFRVCIDFANATHICFVCVLTSRMLHIYVSSLDWTRRMWHMLIILTEPFSYCIFFENEKRYRDKDLA